MPDPPSQPGRDCFLKRQYPPAFPDTSVCSHPAVTAIKGAVAAVRQAKASCGEAGNAATLSAKVQAGANVFCFEIGKICQNRLFGDTLRQHFENVEHTNTHPTYASVRRHASINNPVMS